ncbi:MAG: hypothetical protein LDL41_26055, partial [Coleofasciculus sp. S288]|nr:hypothetical protein [Coleofasciculus sp. S288]
SSSRIRSRCTAILVLAVSALVFVGLTVVRSPTFIIPPADPASPVTVYVVDYGYHSRLILPEIDGGLVQYTYGDWHYFALNQQDFSSAVAALLIPTRGALGRQNVSDAAELQQLIDKRRYDSLLSFEVAGAKAARLLKLLNDRFNRNIDTRVENSITGLSLVQDDQDYTLFHNSNHELVQWLEDLDCQVRGFVMLPNFQVKSPER